MKCRLYNQVWNKFILCNLNWGKGYCTALYDSFKVHTYVSTKKIKLPLTLDSLIGSSRFVGTLGSGINVPARSLISRHFFRGTWTLFQTKGLNFFGKFLLFDWNKNQMLQILLYFSIKGQFSRGHVYFFCHMFKGARLFQRPRLFQTLEYLPYPRQ